MPNENIKRYLKTYVENPDPRYAVMLKGKWGCGKTFFIDEWLRGYHQPQVDVDEEDVVLEPVKVTLYGLRTTEQITTAIDRELHPMLYSKGMRAAKKILNVIGKIAFRTSLDIDGDGEEETAFSATLDSLSLFGSDDTSIKGVRLLVFDDLERCMVDMKELLGFINYFVEHCGCHVILIGDEEHMDGERKKLLHEFKEKTVGREFDIAPDVETAVKYFLEDELPRVEWLTEQRDLIIRVFKETGCDNLRILRQCLYDFKTQYGLLDEHLVANNNAVLRSVLCNFITVYCEYKGKNRELIKEWDDSYFWALLSDEDSEETSAIRELQQKYRPENTDGIDVLNAMLMKPIVMHLESGNDIKDFIENHLRQVQPQSVVDRLGQYINMENDEFVSLCRETEKMLQSEDIKNSYTYGRAIAFLAYFHESRLYWVTQAMIARVKYILAEAINNQSDLGKLHDLRAQYLLGVRSFQTDKQLEIVKDITQYFENAFKDKEATLYSRMELLLMQLDNESVNMLETLDSYTASDHSSDYSITAIFYRLDADKLMKRIRMLSNKGKRTFSAFLRRHFMLHTIVGSIGHYALDNDVIAQLKALTKVEIERTQYVERNAYEYLLKVLDAAEKRCGGETNVLME